MTELERALVALAREIDFPPEPDLRSRVRERIERKRFARPLVLAVALLALAFGIAMAVPPARSAILRFFHIGAVTVEQVETLPAARERPLAAGLGPALPLREAVPGQPNQIRSRLAGNVLLWTEGDRTYRLEGDLNKGQMLELAREITR